MSRRLRTPLPDLPRGAVVLRTLAVVGAALLLAGLLSTLLVGGWGWRQLGWGAVAGLVAFVVVLAPLVIGTALSVPLMARGRANTRGVLAAGWLLLTLVTVGLVAGALGGLAGDGVGGQVLEILWAPALLVLGVVQALADWIRAPLRTDPELQGGLAPRGRGAATRPGRVQNRRSGAGGGA